MNAEFENDEEEYVEFHTADPMLNEFVHNYQRINRWHKVAIHMLFFRFTCNDFAKNPSWETFRAACRMFSIMLWPDVQYFVFPALLALLAVIAWAAAMATGHFALWITMLALAAAAIIKRPVIGRGW